jgi:hypothetical protein
VARTSKAPWSLWFTITPAEGDARAVPTYSARTISVAVLLWVLGLAIHNMLRSGSPFSWEPGELSLPETQTPAGQPAPTPGSQRPRSRKGPPPPKRRRGGGRRR